MASASQDLAGLAEEVMAALIEHGPPESRAQLEDELAVLRKLTLASASFSAKDFIQAEVKREMGA